MQYTAQSTRAIDLFTMQQSKIWLWAPPREVRAEPRSEIRGLHSNRGPDRIIIRQTVAKALEMERLVVVRLEVVKADRPAAPFDPLTPHEIDWVEGKDLATPHARVAA